MKSYKDQFAQYLRGIYQTARTIAQDAITDTFGNAWRGGKWVGSAIWIDNSTITVNGNNQLVAATSGASILLDWNLATDVSGTLTAGTWTDIGTAQSFICTTGPVVIALVGCVLLGDLSSLNALGARILLDGSTAIPIRGGIKNGPQPYVNVIAGGSYVVRSLSAGSHTILVQVQGDTTGLGYYCRPSSHSLSEGLEIIVHQ